MTNTYVAKNYSKLKSAQHTSKNQNDGYYKTQQLLDTGLFKYSLHKDYVLDLVHDRNFAIRVYSNGKFDWIEYVDTIYGLTMGVTLEDVLKYVSDDCKEKLLFNLNLFR